MPRWLQIGSCVAFRCTGRIAHREQPTCEEEGAREHFSTLYSRGCMSSRKGCAVVLTVVDAAGSLHPSVIVARIPSVRESLESYAAVAGRIAGASTRSDYRDSGFAPPGFFQSWDAQPPAVMNMRGPDGVTLVEEAGAISPLERALPPMEGMAVGGRSRAGRRPVLRLERRDRIGIHLPIVHCWDYSQGDRLWSGTSWR